MDLRIIQTKSESEPKHALLSFPLSSTLYVFFFILYMIVLISLFQMPTFPVANSQMSWDILILMPKIYILKNFSFLEKFRQLVIVAIHSVKPAFNFIFCDTIKEVWSHFQRWEIRFWEIMRSTNEIYGILDTICMTYSFMSPDLVNLCFEDYS